MERLTHAFVSDDTETFHRTFRALKARLSQHDNLCILSGRLSEIIQLWSSEKPKMERKTAQQQMEKQMAMRAAEDATVSKGPITSAFAPQTAAPAHARYSAFQQYRDMEQHMNEKTNNEGKEKGKGKMPMTANDLTSPSSSFSGHRGNSDPEIDLLSESMASATFLNGCQRAKTKTTASPSRPRANAFSSSSSSSRGHDGEQQPNDSNDWGVDKAADGVLIGRPDLYPAALLDWDDNDKGKKVADVAPDNLTRAKTAAASTFRAAQGALQGLIGGAGGGGGGSSIKKNENGEEEGKKNRMRKNKGKGKKKEKKGKFVASGEEQEKHVHQYSDNYDSSDGSDWVTL